MLKQVSVRLATSFVATYMLVTILSGIAAADIPPNVNRRRPPDPPAPPIRVLVPLKVKAGRAGDTTRILIPRRVLRAMAANGRVGGTWKYRNHTIVAGVFLSLAAASMVLMRKNKRATKALAIILGLTIAAGGVGLATADLIPPGGRPNQVPNDNGPKVIIEVVNDGDTVTIVKGRGL